MFGSYGLALNIKNIFSLAAPFAEPGEKILKMSDLKPAYVRFLKSIHPEFQIELREMVVRDQELIEQFGKAFSKSEIDDLQQEKMVGETMDLELLEENIALLSKAIAELNTYNPELCELLKLATHTIILCHSSRNQAGFRAHGGTTSRCIGLIWLSIQPTMCTRDVIEMLIHELTHTLVFLDELNKEQFNYDTMMKEPYWALSSILKLKRPMDKVVHSVIVSTELLYARRNYLPPTDETKLVHPDSTKLASNIENSISSVLNHPLLNEVCKQRAIELMINARNHTRELNAKLINSLAGGALNEVAV